METLELEHMKHGEKRKFLRLDSLHLLDYLHVDSEGNERDYSMGRTLDVSINGIKMETVRKIPIDGHLVITLGIEDSLVDVAGDIVHSKESANRFISGIEFNKVSSEDRAVLRQYVDEFQSRKEILLRQNDFPPKE